MLIEMSTKGHEVDIVSYGALIHGLIVAGGVDIASTIRVRMMERGVLPDANIYNVLMNTFHGRGGVMLDQIIAPDAFIYATLVDGFIRHGNLDEAKKL